MRELAEAKKLFLGVNPLFMANDLVDQISYL